jgi:hypothetical protein
MLSFIMKREQFEDITTLYFLIPIFLLFACIGLGILIAGINSLFVQGEIRITNQDVTYTKSSLFGTKKWIEPVSEYMGVLRSKEQRSRGTGNTRTTYTVYVLRLYHADTDKCIPLYESTTSTEWRSLWEDYARILNVPALDEVEGEIVSRDVGDLDKSVRELAEEGKLEIDFDPTAAIPKSINLEIGNNELVITFKKSKLKAIIVFIFVSSICNAMAYTGFFYNKSLFALGVIGIIVEFFFVSFFLLFLNFKTRLVLAPDKITLGTLGPKGPLKRNIVVNTADIEQVVINNAGAVVLITDEDGEIPVVSCFSKTEEKEWIKNCILAIIASS